MKTVYFVRHGESEGNTSPVFTDDTSPLTARGREQAEAAAVRCAKLPVEAVVASTMPRARETAEIINRRLGKPIAHSDLFVERRRPTALLGRNKKESLDLQKAMRANFHVDGYRLDDEETFPELKARALAALDYLAAMPEDRVLVVTHGWFMRIMVACVVFGARLTGEECRNFTGAFITENTGITVFVHGSQLEEGERGDDPWRILTWNDHAHLG